MKLDGETGGRQTPEGLVFPARGFVHIPQTRRNH
jgi:hypothetical protein